MRAGKGLLVATTPTQARALRRRAIASTLGRYSAPEFFYGTTHAMTTGAISQSTVPRPMILARPAESITFEFLGRCVIAGAPFTAGVPEAPFTLLENVTIRGTHRDWGSQVPINLSGAMAAVWPRLFQSAGNDCIIGQTRLADPGMPFVQHASGIVNGDVGTYDIRLMIEIPFGPLLGPSPSGKQALLPFLWRPEDWGDSIQLSYTMGDQTSLGTPAGGSTVTWTAINSASGSPSVNWYVNYSLLGDFARSGRSGLVIRSEYNATPYLTGLATQTNLGQGLAKQITTNIVMKSGRTLTGTSGGVNVFASLSDLQLDATKLVLDNKRPRDTYSNIVDKNYTGRMFNTIQPQGYFVMTFIDGGNPLLAYRGDTVPPGSNFALVTDVDEANAANRQTIVQEQVYGGPYLRKTA